MGDFTDQKENPLRGVKLFLYFFFFIGESATKSWDK